MKSLATKTGGDFGDSKNTLFDVFQKYTYFGDCANDKLMGSKRRQFS